MKKPRWLQTLVDPGVCLSSTCIIPFLCANYTFRQVASLSLGFGPIMLTTPQEGRFFFLKNSNRSLGRILLCPGWH